MNSPAQGDSIIGVDHSVLKEMPVKEILVEMKAHPDTIAIRFASGIRGHFVEFNQRESEFKTVYGGPHGPENRPALVDERNLRILQDECEHIEVIPHDESPFQSVELKDG